MSAREEDFEWVEEPEDPTVHLARVAASVPENETGVRQPHIGTVQSREERATSEFLEDGTMELGTEEGDEWMTTTHPVISIYNYR